MRFSEAREMSPSARREYVREMRERYRRAEGRREKIRLVKETSAMLRCHRKHAGVVLRGRYWQGEGGVRYREPIYSDKLIRILEVVWAAAQYPWSVRLKALLFLWLPWIKKRWELDPRETRQLLAISPATMDRRLAPYKRKLGRRIYGKTKPGRFLRQVIPIQTESSGVKEPGWMEVDTVSHSGPSAHGVFANTLDEVDLCSGWVELVAILGKSAEAVVAGQEEIRAALPFDLLGTDSDNGDEFINWEMERYCRSKGVRRFRSRAYKKDDQAHIEQKNGTHVRRIIGWDRYDTQEAVDAMNALYRQEWRLLTNLLLPSVKLKEKIRIGSRIKRVYDNAKTPLDRLIKSKKGDRAKLEEYRLLRERLDPFELSRKVDQKLDVIWKLATRTRIAAASKPLVSGRAKPNWPELPLEYNPPAAIFLLGRNSDIARIRKLWWRDRFFGAN